MSETAKTQSDAILGDDSELASTFLAMLRRYRDLGVVYASPRREQNYCVAEVNDQGCEIQRLGERARTNAKFSVKILFQFAQALREGT
ncbi:MAG: hypothetical protein QGG09_16930, partial [Pirellulaceae bacterium]|nr:hypothetical protein [Pirellulaceae bacterium]